MKLTRVTIGGEPASAFEGGQGPAVLLLHGGWAGAEAHYGPIWDELAHHHRVIAPELPGVPQGRGLDTIRSYADWTVQFLDALGVDSAVCVGNSLGAAIATSLAAHHPKRITKIVLVNGGMPADSLPLVRGLLKIPFGRKVLRAMIRYNLFSSSTIGRAFADPDKAPAQVKETMAGAFPKLVDLMMKLFIAGDPGAPAPRVPTLILWGLEDHLIGVSERTPAEFMRRIPGARTILIEGAGHMPQVEKPREFLQALEGFLAPKRPQPASRKRSA